MKEKMQNRLLKLSYALKRNTTLNNKANTIAFLHIGKNAGTQITHVTKQLKKYNIKIKKYHHKTKLADLSRNSQYFFSIRNPATRFLSGFYSRKRKGQPRLNIDWNIHEKIAFEQFEHANDIAENLFSKNQIGNDARAAIKSIGHTGAHQVDWFYRCAYFKKQPPLSIIRQEFFNQDMQRLLDSLNLNIDIKTLLTKKSDLMHSNDYKKIPPLSEKGILNLEKWYIQDYLFYRDCEDWIKKTDVS